MKKWAIGILACLVITCFFYVSCTKNPDNNNVNPNTTDQLMVIKNTNLANSPDTLQAVFKSSTNLIVSYFGSYDASGNPLTLKEVVISRNDTCIKMILDSSLKVKTVIYTMAGVKDSTVLFMRYTDTTTTVCAYKFDWLNMSHKMKSVTTTKNADNSIISSTIFRKTDVDPYLAQIGSANGQIVVYSVLIVGLCTAAGAIVGTIVPAAGTAAGAYVGAAVGTYVVSQAILGGTTVTQNPVTVPDKPSSPGYSSGGDDPVDDLKGTELEQNVFMMGHTDAGIPIDIILYPSTDPTTHKIITIENLTVDIELDANYTTIQNVHFFYYQVVDEYSTSSSITSHSSGVISDNLLFINGGNLTYSTISGNNTINIKWSTSTNDPYWIFNGTITNSKISGLFTIHCVSGAGGVDAVTYDVTASISLGQ